MFAIISTDGKQYHVAQGETIRLERIRAEPGDAFETDQVLAIGGEESELKLGKPVIVGAKVQGTILQHGRDKKVIVFKRKRRKTYRRKYGHRQAHTLVKIDKIIAKAPAAKKVAPEKTASEKAAVKKTAAKKPATTKDAGKKNVAKKAVTTKDAGKKTAAKKAVITKAAGKKTSTNKAADKKSTDE